MTQQAEEARAFHHIRTVIRALRWVAVAVLVLLSGLLIRLYIAPVSIDFLKPVLSEALVFGDSELRLEFDDGVLAWGHGSALKDDWSFLDLDLTGLRLLSAEGRALLTLPEGRVRLSGVALLAGRLAPAALEVEGLKLSLRWSGGDLVGVLGQIGAEDPENPSPAALILALLSPPERGAAAAGYLQQVSITDAEVLFEENLTDSRWQLAGAQLRISRGTDSMLLNGTGMLNREGTSLTRLDLAAIYSAKSRTSHVELLFENFNPTEIAGESEALTALKTVDMPVSGSVGVTFDENQTAHQMNFDLVGSGGFVDLPAIYREPVRFDRILVSGRYDLATREAVFDDLRLEFVGATIEGDGIAYGGEGGLGLRFFATVRDLPFQWLKVYWPPEVGVGAYRWVSRNLTAGHVTKGQLRLNIEPEMWTQDGLPEDAVDFNFDFTDATAHYLRPMPPITGGQGSALLTAHRFELWATGGRTAGVSLAGSHLRFDDIHHKGEALAEIDARLDGKADDVLALIDNQPLGYPSRYGLDPRSVEGQSKIDLRLTFPLIRNLTLSDVMFNVHADLDPVRLPKLFGDVGVTDGKVVLEVDRKGIEGKGRIALNDVPFDLDWSEDFDKTDALPTRFILDGTLTGEEWKVLSLPIADYVEGPGKVHLTLDGKGPSIQQGVGMIDFQGAVLGFDELGWSKPANEPANARFRFLKHPSGEWELSEVVYEDGNMRGSGSIVIAGEEGLRQMVVDSLKVGETHLAATVTRDPESSYMIAVTAESFDARPFIEKTFKGAGTEGEYTMPSFALDIFASKVLGLNNVALTNLQVSANYRDDRWGQSNVIGSLTGGGSLKFELTPNPEAENRSFALTSDDAGEVARALGLFENGIGGALSFTGTLTDPGTDQEVIGEVRVDKFRVVTAPTLGQILTVGSLAGIRDLLAGDGIGFERLEVPYSFQNSVVTLKKARAWGPAIGLTMSGRLDIKENRAKLKGTIVPAYTANAILGKIPVLGTLLVGGKGQGLFAINYEVSGSLDEPDVSVNPLSMLTPGFLRSIFGAFDEGEPDAAKPEKDATP